MCNQIFKSQPYFFFNESGSNSSCCCVRQYCDIYMNESHEYDMNLNVAKGQCTGIHQALTKAQNLLAFCWLLEKTSKISIIQVAKKVLLPLRMICNQAKIGLYFYFAVQQRDSFGCLDMFLSYVRAPAWRARIAVYAAPFHSLHQAINLKIHKYPSNQSSRL